MDLKINSEISRTNSFTFSNISSLNGSQSQSLAEQQISKLIKFVQCQRNTTVRKELELLLPPIVCHLYVEMLKGKEWRPAHDFLRKYACLVGAIQEVSQQKVNGSDPSLLAPHPIHFLPPQHTSNLHQNIYNRFMPSSTTASLKLKHQPPNLSQLGGVDEQKLKMFRELISNLSSLRRLEDVKDNKLICSFRSCKYKARIANKTLSVLNKFLSTHGHVLLIQILHLWFNMDLYDLHDDDSGSSSSSSSSSSGSSSSSSDVMNNFNYSDNLPHKMLQSSSSSSKDRYTDPSYCDTLDKDIKFNANSGLYFDKSAAVNQICDDNSDFFGGSSSNSSNLKMKRLRECLHRVDSKYHKPLRIFNINYTDNR